MTDKDREIYRIVEALHACDEKEYRNEVFRSRGSDPAFHRAVRIHRHLKALERELLDIEHHGGAEVSLGVDPSSDQVVLDIRRSNIRCRRVAYLNETEFSLLQKNQQITGVLRRCRSRKKVA